MLWVGGGEIARGGGLRGGGIVWGEGTDIGGEGGVGVGVEEERRDGGRRGGGGVERKEGWDVGCGEIRQCVLAPQRFYTRIGNTVPCL